MNVEHRIVLPPEKLRELPKENGGFSKGKVMNPNSLFGHFIHIISWNGTRTKNFPLVSQYPQVGGRVFDHDLRTGIGNFIQNAKDFLHPEPV